VGAITLDTVTLPEDLVWEDEFSWTPVEQASDYTLGGALVVETAARLAGRPVTLAGAEDQGWITRTTLEALYALAQAPSTGLALTLADGRSLTVVFRHGGPAIEARPVVRVSPPAVDAQYIVTVRLLEV
jgi:hypothetical protein